MTDADLLIAGAGAAGLTTLLHALDAPLPLRRIVVVDADPGVGDRRTWCTWTDRPTGFHALADASWDALTVAFDDGARRLPLQRHRFVRVRQRTFDEHVWDRALRDPRVEVVQAGITAIDDLDDGARVVTTAGEIEGGVVVQSVLDPSGRGTSLRQHFAGIEVVTSRPVFDPSAATFMDFRTPQDAGASFLYVLPTAPDRALVEHTVLGTTPRSSSWHLARVADHLDGIGAGAFDVTRTEYGAIPMHRHRRPGRTGRHVHNVGTVGGDTKPSTGFTMGRIQRRIADLVSTWVTDGRPGDGPAPTARHRLADRLLLGVLIHRPDLAPRLFRSMFDTAPIDGLLDFLDERTAPRDELALLHRMEWRPFVAGLAASVGVGR